MNKRRNQRVGVAAMVLTATTVLVGCGASGSGDDDPNSLTYWSMWTKGEPQAKVIQEAATDFEESTGVKIDINWVGRDVLKNVSANLNGGDLPDLVDQEAGELQGTFAAANAAMGLNDVCEAQIPGEDVTVCEVIGPKEALERYQTEDGEFVMMPYEVVSSALWFNGAQMPEVASDSPTTWDQWITLLDERKEDGQAPIALDLEGQYASYWWTWSAVRHAGPGAVNSAVSDETGASWDDPALLAAAKDLEFLVDGGYFTDDYTGTKWPAQQSGWASGENNSDFLLMGSWAPSETAEFANENADGFEYRSMPYPEVEGGEGNDATEVSFIGFSIPKKAENPEQAKEFIKFFLSKEQLSGISEVALNLTPREDIEVPSQLTDLKEQVGAAETTFQPDDGVSADHPRFTVQYLYPLSQQLLRGKLDAAAFIEAMKAATVEYRETNG